MKNKTGTFIIKEDKIKTIIKEPKSKTIQKMTNDQFAKFMFNIGLNEIKNYNYDIFYDISKVINFANHENYRDDFGQIITNKPVTKEYILHIRNTGSYLIESDNLDFLKSLEKSFDHHLKYKIIITANCSYLNNVPFAIVEQIN